MNSREYNKMQASVRRSVGRRYGFRQRDFINFKVEKGYFFNIEFLSDASLSVKPMYADDLWWDIFHASGNKKEPVSLRGIGTFALEPQPLADFAMPDSTDRNELESQYEKLFHDVSTAIAKFLDENPDADRFYPDEEMMRRWPYNLLNIMALIHNGRKTEAIETAKKGLTTDVVSRMKSFKDGRFIDGYEFVIDWCEGGPRGLATGISSN